jgi:hypothetical protein
MHDLVKSSVCPDRREGLDGSAANPPYSSSYPRYHLSPPYSLPVNYSLRAQHSRNYATVNKPVLESYYTWYLPGGQAGTVSRLHVAETPDPQLHLCRPLSRIHHKNTQPTVEIQQPQTKTTGISSLTIHPAVWRRCARSGWALSSSSCPSQPAKQRRAVYAHGDMSTSSSRKS